MNMLADDVQTAAVKVTVQCAEVTVDVLKAVIKAIAEKKKLPKFKRGFQKLKQLNKQGEKLDSQLYENQDIVGFKKELKEYGVDFAVVKGDKPTSYSLFFKAKDSEQILTAFHNYLGRTSGLNEKPAKISIKARIEKAVERAKDLNQRVQQTLQQTFKRNKGKAL